MANDRMELLRRFYLQLELIAEADLGAKTRKAQRIGDLYDDEAPSPWGRMAVPHLRIA